eukprot:TRINITY_DN26806_c0_g1_i1.p1 TRINITY_DN26806_c0_g1~~TRINITY_DN26806_c0_g1_i1.p1  ORF type:complete len:903 (-),score=186.90 TRINITY_DN26806_c0_g1_i1:400-3108(-)
MSHTAPEIIYSADDDDSADSDQQQEVRTLRSFRPDRQCTAPGILSLADGNDDDSVSGEQLQRRPSKSRRSIVTALDDRKHPSGGATDEPIAKLHASSDLDLLRRTYSKARKTINHFTEVQKHLTELDIWETVGPAEGFEVGVSVASEDHKGKNDDASTYATTSQDANNVASNDPSEATPTDQDASVPKSSPMTSEDANAPKSSPMRAKDRRLSGVVAGVKMQRRPSRLASKGRRPSKLASADEAAVPAVRDEARAKRNLDRVHLAAKSVMHGVGETIRERRAAADTMARLFIAAFRCEQFQTQLQDVGEMVDDESMAKISEAFSVMSALKIKRVESVQKALLKVMDTSADQSQTIAAWAALRENLKAQLDEVNNSSAGMMRTVEQANQQANDIKRFFALLEGARQELAYNRMMTETINPPKKNTEHLFEQQSAQESKTSRGPSPVGKRGPSAGKRGPSPAGKPPTKYLLDTAVKRVVCVNQVRRLTSALFSQAVAAPAKEKEQEDIVSSLQPILALAKHATSQESNRSLAEEETNEYGFPRQWSEGEDPGDSVEDRSEEESVENRVAVAEEVNHQYDEEELEASEQANDEHEGNATNEGHEDEQREQEEDVVNEDQIFDGLEPVQISEPTVLKAFHEDPKTSKEGSPKQQLRRKILPLPLERQEDEEYVDEERPVSQKMRISKRHMRNLLTQGSGTKWGSPTWARQFLQAREDDGSDLDDSDTHAEKARPSSKAYSRPSAPSSAAGGPRPRLRYQQQNLMLQPKPESTWMMQQRTTKTAAGLPRAEAVTMDRILQADPQRCLVSAREQEELWVPRLELKPVLGLWDEELPASKTARPFLFSREGSLEVAAPPTLPQALAPLSARPGTGMFRRFVEVQDDSHQNRASSFLHFHCKLSRHLMSR